MLYQIATAALAFSTNSAVLSSKVRMPAASMVVGAPNSVGGMFTLSDDLHKQVTFIDSGLAAENDQFVSTGVVGKVVPPSTAAAAAPTERPLRSNCTPPFAAHSNFPPFPAARTHSAPSPIQRVGARRQGRPREVA